MMCLSTSKNCEECHNPGFIYCKLLCIDLLSLMPGMPSLDCAYIGPFLAANKELLIFLGISLIALKYHLLNLCFCLYAAYIMGYIYSPSYLLLLLLHVRIFVSNLSAYHPTTLSY